MKLLLLVVLVSLCCAVSMAKPKKDTPGHDSSLQSFHIKGRLFCGDKPAAGVEVKLVDTDTAGRDDTIKKGTTAADGTFDLHGEESEWGDIDVLFKIYHDCNDNTPICQRRWKFELPDKYISRGPMSANRKVYDFGTWNLEAVLPNEDIDCIH
jgi:5-hydroxyisourate hydrolase-like protein (transthyretin family)